MRHLWELGLVVTAGVTGALFLSHCSRGTGAETRAAVPADTAVAMSHVDGSTYKIDTSLADCGAGMACIGTIRLEALGAYHINETFPYKFKANAGQGLEFLGKDAADRSVFSKNTDDFQKQGEKVGLLAVRYKAPPGKVSFNGKFKFSVCSDANCLLEQADLSFDGAAK